MSNDSAPSTPLSDSPTNPEPPESKTDASTPSAPTSTDLTEDTPPGDKSQDTPDDAQDTPDDKTSPTTNDTHSNPPQTRFRKIVGYVKSIAICALLGILTGALLAYPTYWARKAISNYMETREQIAKYGEELPEEVRTALLAYHQLHDNFYSEISTYDLLNGALVSINASIAIEKDKANKNKDDKKATDTDPEESTSPEQDGDANHKSTEAQRLLKLAEATAPKSAKDQTGKDGHTTKDDDQNETELTLAQAYQEYAKAVADSVKSAKVEIVYPLLPKEKQNSPEDDLVQQFTVTMLRVLREHKISRENACYSAVSGMTMATADPYTTALDKEETRSLNEAMGNEEICGIGAYLEIPRKGEALPTVIENIEDSPAEKEGLQAGDVIIAVDGTPTKDLSLSAAVERIRGPQGTKVVLTIKRAGQPEFDVTISRGKVTKKSVSHKMVGDHAGYVRLRFFGHDTSKDCKQALLDLLDKQAKALILDMRNNSGGAVVEAVLVASLFLPKDTLVTTVSCPRNNNREDYCSVGQGVPPFPMVVLVNGYSASASEIVAGALKDSHRALLVGETTFGKGSVQIFNSIGSDLSMKYTIAHYLTPGNHDIHLKGIAPNIECKAPFSNHLGDDNDIQLQEALKQLNLQKKD